MLSLVFFMVLWSMRAFAASTISSAGLDLTDFGNEIVVDLHNVSSPYSISNTGISGRYLTVKLKADSGYTWRSGIAKSDIKLYGDYKNSNIYSLSGGGSSLLTIKVDIEGGVYGTTVSNVKLDKNSGLASWDGNGNRYEVKLYRDSGVVTTKMTTGTSYDLSGYFTKNGSYYVSVRVNNNSGSTGSWKSSPKLSLSRAQADQIRGYFGGITQTVYKNGSNGTAVLPGGNTGFMPGTYGTTPLWTGTGWWMHDGRGWLFMKADSTYTKNTFEIINNRYYYFGTDGYMQTGWIQIGNNWYYMGADGAMLTNVWTPDGYYVNDYGVYVPGMGRNTAQQAANQVVPVVVGHKYTG